MHLPTMLLAVLTILAVPAAAVPLTEGFEENLQDLSAEGWHLPKTASLATRAPKRGEQCLKMVVPEATHRYAELFIPVETGKFYRAEAWIRCKGVEDHPEAGQNRGAVIFLQWADKDKKWVAGGSFPKGLHGDHHWTLCEVPYTRQIPPEVAYLQLLIGVEGTGTAWFDDLKVEEVSRWDGLQVVSPQNGAEVDTALPLLDWKTPDREMTGELHLSRSPDFPPDGTIVRQAERGEYRPISRLAAGKWFWRIQAVSNGRKLPPGPKASFVVPENAPVWPPRIRPMWHWSDAPRPKLSARITPPEAADTVKLWIDEAPAEFIRREDDLFTFRPVNELPQGVHAVRVQAIGVGGRKQSTSGIFCNKQPGVQVTIREDNVLLVDGEPFFPIGAYRDPSDTLTDFSGLKQAGFNVTHSYRFEDRKPYPPSVAREYLHAAHENGMKVFMGFHRGHVRDADYHRLQSWAAELMDEPALLTWYLMDEPAAQGVPAAVMSRMNQTIHAVDPFHPTSIVICRPRAMADYAAACDILWSDPYPIPSRPLTMVEERVTQGIAATSQNQPFWVVLQAHDLRYWRDFDKAVDDHGPVSRPTYRETRCMAFMSLAAGANGIIWYWGPNRTYHMVEDAPQVWEGLCKTVAELQGLMPFLVAHRSEYDSIVASPPAVRTWSRRADARRLMALINVSGETTGASVDLSRFNLDEILARDGSEKTQLENGVLRVSLGPHEVKLYEWRAEH